MTTWLYPFPDPFAVGDNAASYTTDSAFRRFMGDQLVECRVVTDDGVTHAELWIIGDTTVLFDTDTETLLARDDTGAGVPIDEFSMGATTDAVFVGLVGPDAATVYWVVGSDGTQSFYDSTGLQPAFLVPDQRLEATLREYPASATTLDLATIPPGSSLGSVDVGELADNNAKGSTWAAIILGDTSNPRDQPTPPDPFTVSQVSNGHHTDDGAVVFDFWDETGDIFSAWDDARVSWTGDGDNEPSMNFGFILQVGGVVIFDVPRRLPGGNEGADLPTDGTLIDQYRQAYGLPTAGGNVRAGQLSVFYNPDLNTSTPSDYMDSVEAVIAGTATITPVAPLAYRQGEYRYIRNGLDDESTYVFQGKGAPGTEYMWSQLFEDTTGRWTGVVSLQQDGDNYGDGTQCSLCVYFEPGSAGFAGVTRPLRLYPRTDGLGTSSARRLYPPSRSIQASNRRAGGYI